ncbi:FecR family protein [Pontibacter harenae]|uniref:FecR family protein n=1 Tax=Pontibacter harenae TaxID=2894083 RepID=UPI001E59C105|nr:FecR domain-containing protein [Pontibacter harenae]MCC9166615.1 FecR domain-containing protein [Pontibacter harenae]
MDYIDYSVADFAADPFFIEWVKYPDEENDAFWVEWLKENPKKLETVQDARQIVLAISNDEDLIPEWELETVWANINEARKGNPATIVKEQAKKSVYLWKSNLFAAAAMAVILLSIMALFLYTLQSEKTEYVTNYGERRSIELPDGSKVVLNANSKLAVPNKWPHDKPREVQLEVYFTVRHKHNHQKFIVHTSAGNEVEVLGTEFNVSDRGNKEQVVLTSGELTFKIANSRENRRIKLNPSELVEVMETTDRVVKKDVRTEKFTSWKDNKVIFDATPLRDIATLLEHDYGYEVVLKDEKISNYKITAQFVERSLNKILTTLSDILGVKVKKTEQQIIISPSNTT